MLLTDIQIRRAKAKDKAYKHGANYSFKPRYRYY